MKNHRFTIYDLADIIQNRKLAAGKESYTKTLLNKGPDFIGRKLLEETMEVILESHDGNRERILQEIGDLIYHTLILAAAHDFSLYDIEDCLSKRDISSSMDHKKILSKLKSYLDKTRSFNEKDLISALNIREYDSQDVLLFSHNFWKSKKKDVTIKNRFSIEAKEFKNFLQGEQIKTKFAIEPNQQLDISDRRGSEFLIPIILILNSGCLPLTLNILAAYLKEWIDKKLMRKEKLKSNIEINLGLKKTTNYEEKWYRIVGAPNDVLKILERLSK